MRATFASISASIVLYSRRLYGLASMWMVKMTRRVAPVIRKNIVRLGEQAKVVASMTLHRKRSPANMRQLSLKTPWKESMRGRSLRINQGVVSSLSVLLVSSQSGLDVPEERVGDYLYCETFHTRDPDGVVE